MLPPLPNADRPDALLLPPSALHSAEDRLGSPLALRWERRGRRWRRGGGEALASRTTARRLATRSGRRVQRAGLERPLAETPTCVSGAASIDASSRVSRFDGGAVRSAVHTSHPSAYIFHYFQQLRASVQ